MKMVIVTVTDHFIVFVEPLLCERPSARCWGVVYFHCFVNSLKSFLLFYFISIYKSTSRELDQSTQ